MSNATKRYHKENLRADLLQAAQKVVASEGHEQLSIRRLAQETQVSPGAPYHHFPDKRSLLLAVALEGYQMLNGTAISAKQTAKTPEKPLFDACKNFLAFAGENPRLMTLMYDSELTRPVADPAIAQAQMQGYKILEEGILQLRPDLSNSELSVKIASLWSTIFGFATLRNLQMIQVNSTIKNPFSQKLVKDVVTQAIQMVKQELPSN